MSEFLSWSSQPTTSCQSPTLPALQTHFSPVRFHTSSTKEKNLAVYQAWKPGTISQDFFLFLFTLGNVCHLFQEIVLCF